jgi:hypothetical protein
MRVRPLDLQPGDKIDWFGGVVKDVEDTGRGILLWLETDPVPYPLHWADEYEVHRDDGLRALPDRPKPVKDVPGIGDDGRL